MKPQSQDLESQPRTASRTASQPPFALRPNVDVFENSEGITLWADMPGVSRERLSLHADGNTLLLEGNIEFPMGDDLEALHGEVRSTQYRCSFALSNELDTGRIDANLKDGVLTVRIPKRAELRPRRIEVRAV
jgi:HSP20 family molecular chaperone IbpA